MLHIVTFLVSFVAFEILFLSSFTSLLVGHLLKRKEGLWIFELTPSLEGSTRAARWALLVGFAAFTVGLLSAYLYARTDAAALPEGWRVDVKVYLTTFTWLAYLIALIAGFRSGFRGRAFHIASMASFAPLLLTLLSSLLWSDFHRFPR